MYTVIEYTPGYMPDDDDPPVFDQFEEAFNYLSEYRREILNADWAWEYPPDDSQVKEVPEFMLDVEDIVVSGKGDTGVVHAGFSYTDRRKMYDLGRVVEIVPVEATDEEIERSFDAYR